MLFADRLKTLKECGIDNARDVIDYMDQVKQTIAGATSLHDGNTLLATLDSPTGIQTKIVERTNSAANQNVAVVTFDTRRARNGPLLTDLALRQDDRLSLTRTLEIAQERAGTPTIRVMAGFTQGNTVKPVPLRIELLNSTPLRAPSSNLGGRLRDKIALCLLGGRQIQLLSDETMMFQNMATERRLALGELGLVLDKNGIIRMRTGDGMGDVSAMYFDLIGEGSHRAMFRSLIHFARIEPVFITPYSKRPEFRAWYQAFDENRYHTDPRVLRGFGAAGIVIEHKTMLVRFPGETDQRQATGFYFYAPNVLSTATVRQIDLNQVPTALLLAAAQRLEMLPEEPDLCDYLRQPGAADYLWKNILGPRGIALGQTDHATNIETRFGRPYFREPVRLFYDSLDHGEFPYIADCFASMRVVTALLGKVRQHINLQATTRAQIDRNDFIRIINDVSLDLSRGKIGVAFLFEQPSVLSLASMSRKLQQALSLCDVQSKEYEFLSAVRTALAGVLINIEFT